LLLLLLADKTVFPKMDVVGWYATGAAVSEEHMLIHKKVREVVGRESLPS
jgi:hypothetical protein